MIVERPRHLVASMGGVGSTMLMEFLAARDELAVNPPTGVVNPLKHAVAPPELGSVERAVFIFGCPYASLISLFERGYADLHYVNVAGRFPVGFRWPGPDAWRQTCDRFGLRPHPVRPGVWIDAEGRYADDVGAIEWLGERRISLELARTDARAMITGIAREAFRDLDDYLERGVDAFRRTEQLEKWTRGGAGYPILMLRYETMWQRIDELLDFLELPRTARADFPARRGRRTSLEAQPPARREALERMYGELSATIETLPDAKVIAP